MSYIAGLFFFFVYKIVVRTDIRFLDMNFVDEIFLFADILSYAVTTIKLIRIVNDIVIIVSLILRLLKNSLFVLQ